MDDGGNGFSCDWADWIRPRFVGPAGELLLTSLKWNRAETQWGQVAKNRSADGGSLRVDGELVENGLGTHANSLIEFTVPAGYTRFVAQAGLDNGGTDQGGDSSSVRFLVYNQLPPAISSDEASERTPDTAIANLDVHPELEASLFAAEPRLLSPSNIDIDHRGRVWVCEIVNYRGHNGKRSEGDRILILEDTDGDGEADSEKVYYQGRDIDSPHGVCVLGNQVIVSAGSQVLCFTDENGDDIPDQKQVWFSGISGVQHDHGIHAFLFGPDGKLYFNFGNEGRQLLDAEGRPIVDRDGHEVNDQRRPYQQGMVFRCNLDLTEFETIGWNFRNNWMATVDSFGTVWQSDNDDDGNRGVRINFVMEFGNYGYRDEMTGAGWNAERTGMEAEIPLRHWHLNDPGVVPNLLQTGAGSPTGITVYEGNVLPEALQGQLIHCDAGPSVTRAYVVSDDGAGYRAESVNLLQGARDVWFRPSDVKVAPDGTLIVADWYDPGVGGHGMGDLTRGRLFRLRPKQSPATYRAPQFDFTTVDGAISALQNPNYAVRYLAFQALRSFGTDAEPALQQLSGHDNPIFRARALWILGKLPARGGHYVAQAMRDSDPRIRCVAIRLARQLGDVNPVTISEQLVNDPSAQVRRECAIALRHQRDPRVPAIWAQLAQQHDGQDRWYLEALGIGADGQWDRCLDAWLQAVDNPGDTPTGRVLIWRSRAAKTPGLLVQILHRSDLPTEQAARYLRALDFQTGGERDDALLALAFPPEDAPLSPSAGFARTEALRRLPADLVHNDPARRALIERQLQAMQGTADFVNIVARFGLHDHFPSLVRLIASDTDPSLAVLAARTLLEKGQRDLIQDYVAQATPEEQQLLIATLGRSADNRAAELLQALAHNLHMDLEIRRAAVRNWAKIREGATTLIALAEKKALPEELVPAAAAELQVVPWRDVRDAALRLFPLAAAKDNRPLPPIQVLVSRKGDTANGRQVFLTSGTCAKCHQVGGDGKQVGPNLSEIGSKLSREAMFESILYPSAAISHSYETYVAELHDGNIVAGLLVSQTDDMVALKNQEGIVTEITRAIIEQLTKQSVSLMPADLHQAISEQELIDVVEYLTTLQKP